MDRTGVVLVAAGRGERFGRPKAFVELGGRTLLARAAAAFEAYAARVAVLPDAAFELDGWTVVAGGARRRDSVAAGLAALPPTIDTILVHDCARALIPAEVVARVVEAARTHDCVIPVVPVVDTIKRVDGVRVEETLDRAHLVAVQTPQAFRRSLLERALAAFPEDATDEAGLVERLGEAVHTVEGAPRNLKITHPDDLRLAEALLT
ncbi:MAG: 2-C-methyl-D-erythritol 4-phosphate cytidylyltransferase [Planctomycetota bacterium]